MNSLKMKVISYCSFSLYVIEYKVVSLLMYYRGDRVARKTYAEGSFGAYFVKLIKDHHYSQSKFASELGVSKTYLFDVFNGRVKPPTPDMQDRIIELLSLEETEKTEFYTKAAEGRKELPKDIVDYLTNNQSEIDNLRDKMRCDHEN